MPLIFIDSPMVVHILHNSHGGSDSPCDDLFVAFQHARQHVIFEFSHARREANWAAYSLDQFAVIFFKM